MKLYDLYVRFMVWLGAEPPPGYEYLLPQAAKMPPPPQPQSKVAPNIPKTPAQPAPKPAAFQPTAPPKPKSGPAKAYPPPPAKKVYTGEALELYHNLLLKALHDEGVVERLIRYERERNPRGSDVEILRAAIDRWEVENRSWR